MPGQILRIALILELGWWAAIGGGEPTLVSKKAIEAAIVFVDDYVKPMALRVYGDAALPIPERDATIIAKWIITKGVKRFNAREMRRSGGLPGLGAEPKAVDAALGILSEAGWIRSAHPNSGMGRPAKDFDVNPGVQRIKL
jgi:hypothetical protein